MALIDRIKFDAPSYEVLVLKFPKEDFKLGSTMRKCLPSAANVREIVWGKRIPFSIVLVSTAFALSGCFSPTAYVDPNLPKVAYGDLPKVENPQLLELAFEFQTNGKRNGQATKHYAPRVKQIVESSNFFSAVVPSATGEIARLDIVMNNVADVGEAFSKGFKTGFTFGTSGTMVTDGYVFTAKFQSPGKQPIHKLYRHAIHSTIGNKEGPSGLEPMPLQMAVEQVVEQLVLNLLRDLQNDDNFRK